MKKVLAALLTMVMMLTLSSCGQTSAPTKEPTKEPTTKEPTTKESTAKESTVQESSDSKLSGQTVSMVIWGNDSRKASYDKLFAAFTEKTGIKVEITLVPLEEIVTKTSAQIVAGQSYDMVWMSEAMLPQFITTGNLEDISDIMNDKDYDFSDLSQSVCANYIMDGKLYAVPFTSSPRVWFYNKDLIAQAGLEDPYELAAKGEWTYEKLIEMSKKISALNDSTYGFSIWNYQSPNDWNILLDWTWSNGASFFNEDMSTCTINTPEGIAALDMYKQCIESGLTPTPDSSVDFASGQLGFTRNTISLKGTLGDVNFNWDIIPNPSGSDKNAPVAVGVAAYVVPKGALHKEAAMEAIKYITSKEMMSSDFLISSFSPLRASILNSDRYLDQGGRPSSEALKLAILKPMSGSTRLYPTCDFYDEADLKTKEILSAWYGGSYADTAAMVADMEAQLNPILTQ